MNNPISTRTHGILDYLYGIVLLLAPNIFGFDEMGGAAVLIPRILGFLVLGQSLITDYELSIAKILPMRTHLVMDIAVGAFLALSPLIFGFINAPTNAWLPHIVAGIAVVIIALLTRSARTESENRMATT